ncbi:MAG: plsC 6 [Frankiales bacterium]|nr:plsC 6 [Frankiales bacterium]
MRLGRIGFWYRLAIVILKPLMLVLTKRRWSGFDNVPAEGGVILAANHISYVDPIALGDAIAFSTKRMPKYLAKASLFEGNGIVGRTMRGAGQIPVHRNTADASAALKDAVDALHRGELVAIYPEGTVSRDPGKWPMAARTGVARLALLSGVPVIPVAQWGAQEIHDSYRAKGFHLFPRHDITVVAGPPVDLDAFRGKELTSDVLHGATERIMDAIRELLEGVRGEQAPSEITPGPVQT